jgi:glycosyltransferase involved in cell wall biosynthesis
LPPPINGLSVINQHILAALRERRELLDVADLSPTDSGRWKKIVSRSWKLLVALRVIASAKRKGGTTLYMPCDGGLGISINIVLSLLALALGYEIFFHHHSYAYISRKSLLMVALLRVSRKSATHVFLCEKMSLDFQQRYRALSQAGRHQPLIVSNGFIMPPPSDVGSGLGQTLRLGHLSNLTIEKGVLIFIEIFEEMRQSGLPVSATVAGSTSDSRVTAALRSAEARHADSFSWVGPVYGEDKDQFFKSIDLFLFPTMYSNEAQPLVLFEALSHSLPIFSLDRGCIGCNHNHGAGIIADDIDKFRSGVSLWAKEILASPKLLGAQRTMAALAAVSEREMGQGQLEVLMATMTKHQ